MVEFVTVINQVITLFVILVVGIIAGKFKILDSIGIKKLSEVLLYITSPMLVLSSFSVEFSGDKIINILWVMGMSSVIYIVTILLSKIFYGRFDQQKKPVLRFTMIFSNSGYMGIPLMKALFGNEGAFYGSFLIVVFNIFLWSVGYVMFGGKGTKMQVLKKVVTTPAVIAMYVGLLLLLIGISMPDAVMTAVSSVGDMTMPVSMLIIGGVMSRLKFIDIFKDWRVYFSSFIRLIFMPLLGFLISKIVGMPELPGLIIITALAMPAAANTTIFSEMFDKDSMLASKCVVVSTLLSIITIPIIIYLSML
ncbi:MAG: AEC family transporter [Clostridiaceae bacterium]|nr:AEC family transporter [Clostridiaceae bacterium]